MNYHNKSFRPVSLSENSAVDGELVFHYQQHGNVLTCTYQGEKITRGQLLGIVSSDGVIDMRYHQINNAGEFMTGRCTSVPEVTADGRIRLNETWQWTSGDRSQGHSILEEVAQD